ncbi:MULTISPECIES: ATP-binding protein [unclassified Streptomyces]|uniref:ATP-binding protein n=1 Tax=unclassified Streptomyces TaxID=2593676 RepID=UPI002366004E|nr:MULTISPECIES: ATP-binding protein [unclassified Streptomyces]MDF3146110.1 ATP-binding protein [Streptomyces sp. T21Q-yed]WDF39746.1 ATP-binding protein [Streptomyces sp. T12]
MNHVTALPEEGLGARYGTDFTLGEHSARHLRRILRRYLAAWEMDDLYDSASLALTELIANVVRHCPDRRAAVLILRLSEGRGLRVEVTDTSPRPPLSTAVDGLSELSEDGRGVAIVEAVTDRWGWVPLTDRPGKTVWFECDGKAAGRREVNSERREGNGC